MATTILSNYGAPTINSIAAERILSNTILDNIYQGIIEKDGKGVTQRFTTDCSGAEIRFVHVKPIFAQAREIGASINGGNFPSLVHEGETDSFGLPVLTVLDDPIDLAQVNKDMIPVDLAAQYIKNYTDQVNLNINAMTVAGKYYSTMLASANGSEVNITSYATNGNFANAIEDANSLLDEGVEAMGVSMFPQEDRVTVIQTAYRPILRHTGVLIVGGANYAYDTLKKGSIDATSEPRKNEDGFIGSLDGVDVHIAAPLVFKVAGLYLGLAKGDITEMIGYVSSAFANVRGIASPRGVKVIDAPQGQGTRFQPLTRMGFKVVEGYEKGNSLICKDGYVNIYSQLKTIFSLGNYDNFLFRGVGSRISLSPTLTTSAATKVKLTDANAYKLAVVGVTTGTKITSVSEFIVAYNAAATNKKGVVDSAQEVTKAGITGCDCYGLVMASDGTCALTSAVAVA